MKSILMLMASLTASLPALGNQVFVMRPDVSAHELEGGIRHTEATAKFRGLPLSLSVVTGRKGTPLESIGGSVDGVTFQVDLSRFPPDLDGLRTSDIRLSADCCIFGALFYWYIPYGKRNERCKADTPTGSRRGRARKEIRIEVDGEGKLSDVQIYELCIR